MLPHKVISLRGRVWMSIGTLGPVIHCLLQAILLEKPIEMQHTTPFHILHNIEAVMIVN